MRLCLGAGTHGTSSRAAWCEQAGSVGHGSAHPSAHCTCQLATTSSRSVEISEVQLCSRSQGSAFPSMHARGHHGFWFPLGTNIPTRRLRCTRFRDSMCTCVVHMHGGHAVHNTHPAACIVWQGQIQVSALALLYMYYTCITQPQHVYGVHTPKTCCTCVHHQVNLLRVSCETEAAGQPGT